MCMDVKVVQNKIFKSKEDCWVWKSMDGFHRHSENLTN